MRPNEVLIQPESLAAGHLKTIWGPGCTEVRCHHRCASDSVCPGKSRFLSDNIQKVFTFPNGIMKNENWLPFCENKGSSIRVMTFLRSRLVQM